MKGARLVVLGVALAAGGIAAYLAAGGSKAPPPPPPTPVAQTPVVDVLVAKSDLIRGQVIADRDIGWQTWPAEAANSDFIKKSDHPDAISQFTGAIVRAAMVAGDPIRNPNVVMAKGSGYMAAVLPQGMRAVSIDITPESGAAGFILPDDRVDVMLTGHDKAAEKATGEESIVSQTILRNVQVLAVDQSIDQKGGTTVAIAKTATLELTESQAETLAASRQRGAISLTLRSLLDANSSPAEGDEDKPRAITVVRFGIGTTTGSSWW
jgi:pilus assembly protein CpaB